jgi:hypothetical protein
LCPSLVRIACELLPSIHLILQPPHLNINRLVSRVSLHTTFARRGTASFRCTSATSPQPRSMYAATATTITSASAAHSLSIRGRGMTRFYRPDTFASLFSIKYLLHPHYSFSTQSGSIDRAPSSYPQIAGLSLVRQNQGLERVRSACDCRCIPHTPDRHRCARAPCLQAERPQQEVVCFAETMARPYQHGMILVPVRFAHSNGVIIRMGSSVASL